MNKIIWKETVDSTNDEMKRLSFKLEDYTIIAAREQTAGRGQGDHKWHSDLNMNITCSLLFRPKMLAADKIVSINHAVSIGLCNYLKKKGITSRIKWPNDIWVGDKKICGLLIENTLSSSNVKECIIGIGFNLNQTQWPVDLPNPVSLKELCGIDFNPETELRYIQNEICRCLELIDGTDGRISLQEEFEKYVFRLQ